MITIDVDDVPNFLRSGSFYKSLDAPEQHDEIQVPESCYVENDEVNNIADLAKLIKVVAFWTLHSIPVTMIVFCSETEPSIWRDVLAENEELDFAKALLSIFESTTPLEKAIELGHTEVVKYLAQNTIGDVTSCVKAAELGRLDYLSILNQYGHPWDEKVCEKAAANGHLHCLKYLHESDCPWNKSLHIVGKPNCVQYAYEQGLEWDENIVELVDASGQADTLKYFIERGCTVDAKTMTSVAQHAEHGHLDVMSFWGLDKIPLSLLVFCGQTESDVWRGLLEERSELDFAQDLLSIFHPTVSFEKAIELEIDEAVDYLADKYVYGVYPDGVIYSALAAEIGRLDYLTLLHGYGHPFDETACEKAASNGHLECLEFLHEMGCPWDHNVHHCAAVAGHLHIIQFASANGLSMPENLAEHVASCGQLAIIQHLVENNTIVSCNVAKEAAKAGHVNCLKYLLEINCPVDSTVTEAAVENGHLECLKLLHQHSGSAHWDTETISSAAINGQLACLQYLHENGCPWDERTTNSAAGEAHFECLRYAIDNHCPYESNILTRCIHTVIPSNVQCLEYLSIALEYMWQRVAADGSLFKRAFLWGNHYAVQYLISQKHPYMSCVFTKEDLENILFTITIVEDDTFEYDRNLAKCIACLVSNSWSFVANGEGLRNFISAHVDELPLSASYLSNCNNV